MNSKRNSKIFIDKCLKNQTKLIAFVLAVVLAFSGSITVIASQIEHVDGENTNTLGASTQNEIPAEVTSVAELEALAKAINEGANHDINTKILLIEDIDLSELEKWTPIGTADFPFKGSFDGNGHTIKGLGRANCTSLFGTLKNASIKNVIVQSEKMLTDNNPYEGLLVRADESNLENCTVLPTPFSLARFSLFANVSADVSWYSAGPTSFTLSAPSQLLGLAQLVEGGNDFSGKEIVLSGTIDFKGVDNWAGIGSPQKPFKGKMTGGIIKNLYSNSDGDYFGFLNYIENADIKNVSIQNADVTAKSYSGILVGYAKNSDITNCMVSGSINGNKRIGGMVGYFYSNNSTSAITDCYSTANVVGSSEVGGLIGAAENDIWANWYNGIVRCFTSGRITGDFVVGGIVGQLYSEDNLGFGQPAIGAIKLVECASNANIYASTIAGGIVGTSEWESISNVNPPISACYFSGRIFGIADTGGISGSYVSNIDSYVSGDIVAPFPFASMFINLGSGHNGWNQNFHGEYNSVYPENNYLNMDLTDPNDAYKNGANRPFNQPTVPDQYFNDSPNVLISPSFTAANLTYIAGPHGADENVGSGTYPQLISFNNGSAPYKTFSKITTEVDFQTFPKTLYGNTGGFASETLNGTDFVLPSVTGIVWKVEGDSSYTFPDSTLPNGVNTISVVNGKIKLDSPMSLPREVELTATFTDVPGLEISYWVNFADTSLRPIFSSMPNAFYSSKSDAKAGNNTLSSMEYLNFLEFAESIQTVGTTASLIEYANNDFTGTTQTKTANIRVINDTILEIKWADTDVKYGKSYELQFVTTNTVEEKVGANNKLVTSYYFRAPINQAPVLSFDTTDPLLAAYPGTATVGSTQTIYMEQSAPLYLGYLNGIMCENESYIDISANPANVSFTVLHTMAGKDVYTGSLATATVNNFHNIPGEYKLDYKVQDKEDSSIYSNVITRVYRVSSPVKVTQGGAPIGLITMKFSSDEMVDIYKNMSTNGKTVGDVLTDEIIRKYITTAGDNQIEAYRHNHEGKPENLNVKFDLSGLTNDVFADGFEQAMDFSVDKTSTKFPYILSIQSAVPNYEIIVDKTTYVAENTYRKAELKEYINARVIRKSDGAIVDMPIYWDFKDFKWFEYDQAQEIKLSLDREEVGALIPEVDVSVTAKVNIVIKKVNKYKHPEDVEDENALFWDFAIRKAKNAETGKRIDMNAKYLALNPVPSDFFLVFSKKDNVEFNLNMPDNITMRFNSDKIYSSNVEEYGKMLYNLRIERMYDMMINRDAQGRPTQQFITSDKVTLPCTTTIIMPLDKAVAKSETLYLYRIDDKTNKYVMIKKLTDKEVADNKLTLELNEFQGRYIVTSAVLKGKTPSTKTTFEIVKK